LGALASASFYIPIKLIKNWEWEVSWMLNGVVSWIILPLLVVYCLLPDVAGFYGQVPTAVLLKTYILGALWGIGGLTFGMTMRFLGMSVGFGVAIGLTLVVGTLLPPIINGEFIQQLSTSKGMIALVGIVLAIVGILVSTLAGYHKEREQGNRSEEFNLKKGVIIAIICGFLSAFMAFAIDSGKPIQDIALAMGVDPLYQIMPSYVVIMLGGFTTNLLYCGVKAVRNNTFQKMRMQQAQVGKNIFLAVAAGSLWYAQFFFYGWGHVQMESAKLGYVSWTLHMSLLVLGGGLWGVVLKEWLGCTSKPLRLLYASMAIIIFSTIVIGIGANR
jgi:L-rhamnose-H+ transport protein